MTGWSGRRIELTVGEVAHGGHCVARHEGRVVFVRHALPGERVLAEVTEDRRDSFCRADAVEILTASPDRVEPPCPLAVPGGCGGCDWQHASGSAQRALKATVVAEQLRRLAGLEWTVEVEALPSFEPDPLLGWRTRLQLATDRDGRAGFRRHRSHEIIPVTDCPITRPGVVPTVTAQAWPPGAELDVCQDSFGELHVRRDGGRWVFGDGVAVQRAADHTWRVAADGFWQVHPTAADTLAQVVADFADAGAGETVWDLYGGAGLFASVLAERVGPDGSVVVVESGERAVSDGETALAASPQVRFVLGRVERVLAGWASTTTGASSRPVVVEDRPPSVVVLDPPRRGAGRAVVDQIAAAGPATVVYVACDPAALARDVASFREHGFELSALRAFDAFPMTHHVECVARLTR